MSEFTDQHFLKRFSDRFTDYIHELFPEFFRSIQYSIVRSYFSHLVPIYDPTAITFESSAREVDSVMQVLKNVIFMVPRVTKFAESRYCIKKYQLVEIFISFLLRLLCYKTGSIIGLCRNGNENLEKDLRFLHTILGDTSFMLCADEHEELQNLLAEFEAVANEAGSLLYLVLFSSDLAVGEINEGLAVVLDHVSLLKTSIMNSLNVVSSTGKSAYTTPRTSVVNSLVFLDSLIYYLGDLVNRDQSNLIADVKDQINTLHHGLISLRSSIKETGLPQPSEAGELKETLMRIGDMVSGGEHLIIAFLVGDAPLWYLKTRLSDINHVIELTMIQIREITRRFKVGVLETVTNSSSQLSLQDHQRNSDSDDIDAAVGLEDQTTDILEHLIGGTKRLQVISIYGMPGVGKTTLAKELYSHPSVIYRFDKLSWSVISQAYQRKSVLTDIFIQLTGENSTLKMDEERLVEHVYKTLKGRRYLIVMDDIWDSRVWDDLRRCFPDDGNGSRILFTTRDKDVGPLNSQNCALGPLSNDQCWELLVKKVFNNNLCPPELLRTGKDISANCHGLPLTVVVIAGVLSTLEKKKSVWEEVRRNLASHIFEGGENAVMNILELSYKHLPYHLKPCFLYFGAYEKDSEIPVSELMRLWIAEGFIQKEAGKSAENVAEEYLIKLIDKSLVMVAKTRSDGGVKACVVHDLLHDLCLQKCEEENFLCCVDENDCYSIYGGHRLLYLERNYAPLIYSQHLRSFCGQLLGSNAVPFDVRDLRLLRVFHYDYFLNLYSGTEYLFSLKYLAVSVLPPWISCLVNLEYLLVEEIKREEMVSLPSTLAKMVKLRYIRVLYPANGGARDCDVGQTNNLEFLSGVVITNLKDIQMLICSPHLRKLKCSYGAELFSKKEAIRRVDLSFFTQLVSLHVEVRGYVMLEKISFPSSIKKLTLSGEFMQLWEEMWMIGRLENLEVLKLRHIRSFMELEDRWDTRDGEFEKLRFLEINNADLQQWNVASSQHFPRLQRLMLRNCYNMGEIPSEIGEITTLQLIQVRGKCRKSMLESARRIQQEQCDMGNDELRILVSKD